MRRLLGPLLYGLAAFTAFTAAPSVAAAQVNFSGSAYVCFDDALFDCDPEPTVLGGFGGTWDRFVNPGGTQLSFQGFNFNVTTDPGTGTVLFNAGNAQFLSGSFTGTFYLGLLFLNAPIPATTLVFTGNATMANDMLMVDFVPNVLAGKYGNAASFFSAQLDDFSLVRGATTPTTITGQFSVNGGPSTTVPEPSTTLLLGAGLGVLAFAVRGRTRRAV